MAAGGEAPEDGMAGAVGAASAASPEAVAGRLEVVLDLPGLPAARLLEGGRGWRQEARAEDEAGAGGTDSGQQALSEPASALRACREEKEALAQRNKALVNMLAVSHLDLERALKELREERLRVSALQWELARRGFAGPEEGGGSAAGEGGEKVGGGRGEDEGGEQKAIRGRSGEGEEGGDGARVEDAAGGGEEEEEEGRGGHEGGGDAEQGVPEPSGDAAEAVLTDA